ncbi:MAG: SDR family oxidoreductase [Candidatus Promineifilaceae bacterium]
MVLVTGAGGKTGRAVAAALLARGVAVRAWVRRPEQVPAGAEWVTGDLLDEAVWETAVSGIDAVYLICPNMFEQETAVGQLAIAAAKKAGISHFVYHSVLHPQTEEMPHHWQKLRVEEMLWASRLPVTVLQPCAYMQNILGGQARIEQAGVYAVPYPVTTRLSLVDLADVAEAAAVVVMEPGHVGATYELCGDDAPTQRDVANSLAAVLGRPVTAVEIPLAVWREQAAHLPLYARETLAAMFAYYARYDFVGNGHVLSWLLKRPSTSLAAFLGQANWFNFED